MSTHLKAHKPGLKSAHPSPKYCPLIFSYAKIPQVLSNCKAQNTVYVGLNCLAKRNKLKSITLNFFFLVSYIHLRKLRESSSIQKKYLGMYATWQTLAVHPNLVELWDVCAYCHIEFSSYSRSEFCLTTMIWGRKSFRKSIVVAFK